MVCLARDAPKHFAGLGWARAAWRAGTHHITHSFSMAEHAGHATDWLTPGWKRARRRRAAHWHLHLPRRPTPAAGLPCYPSFTDTPAAPRFGELPLPPLLPQAPLHQGFHAPLGWSFMGQHSPATWRSHRRHTSPARAPLPPRLPLPGLTRRTPYTQGAPLCTVSPHLLYAEEGGEGGTHLTSGSARQHIQLGRKGRHYTSCAVFRDRKVGKFLNAFHTFRTAGSLILGR